MPSSPINFSVYDIHHHVVSHKLVNSSALLFLFLLSHLIVVLLLDAPGHKATLEVFAYLHVNTIVRIWGDGCQDPLSFILEKAWGPVYHSPYIVIVGPFFKLQGPFHFPSENGSLFRILLALFSYASSSTLHPRQRVSGWVIVSTSVASRLASLLASRVALHFTRLSHSVGHSF